MDSLYIGFGCGCCLLIFHLVYSHRNDFTFDLFSDACDDLPVSQFIIWFATNTVWLWMIQLKFLKSHWFQWERIKNKFYLNVDCFCSSIRFSILWGKQWRGEEREQSPLTLFQFNCNKYDFGLDTALLKAVSCTSIGSNLNTLIDNSSCDTSKREDYFWWNGCCYIDLLPIGTYMGYLKCLWS